MYDGNDDDDKKRNLPKWSFSFLDLLCRVIDLNLGVWIFSRTIEQILNRVAMLSQIKPKLVTSLIWAYLFLVKNEAFS